MIAAVTRSIAAAGAALVSLDSVVNIAFPAMAAAFAVPPDRMRWVIICYVFTYALTSLAGGALADRVGHARVFRTGVALSAVAFALGGLAPTFGAFLGARVVQGFAGGLVYGTAPGIITLAAGPGARARALGVLNAAIGVSYAVGPLGLDGARFFLLAFGGTVIVSRLVGAKLPDRIGARRLSGTALLVTALGLGVMGFLPTVAGLLAGTLLLGLGVAFTTPALASLTVSRAPASERGAALGTFSLFIDLAFGAGPIAMGAVAAASTTPIAFLSAAAVALVGAAILWRWLEDAAPV